jgi:hypothetical protein
MKNNKIKGEYRDSKKNGQGTYTFADGRVKFFAEAEPTQKISCAKCGDSWSVPLGDAEPDDYLNCCPTCTPEAWDADPSNQCGTA